MNEHSLLEDLLRHKLGIVDRKLEELETLGEGDRKLVSVLMAYVKRVETEHAKLKESVDTMLDAMSEQRKNDIDAALEAIDKMRQVWREQNQKVKQ